MFAAFENNDRRRQDKIFMVSGIDDPKIFHLLIRNFQLINTEWVWLSKGSDNRKHVWNISQDLNIGKKPRISS